MGRARTLLALDKSLQLKAAMEIINKSMTVRAAEQFVKNHGAEKYRKHNHKKRFRYPELEHDLSEKLCSQVSIQHSKQR